MIANQTKRAFTVIELVIVIALTAILITIGSISFFNVRAGRALKSALDETAAALREARAKAVTQENGAAWGIRFWNVPEASEPDYYETFYGLNYSTSTVQTKRYLRGGARFASPTEGNYLDVVFSQVKGEAGTSFLVAISPPGASSAGGEISVTPLGAVKVSSSP